jgi:hypothetical protein
MKLILSFFGISALAIAGAALMAGLQLSPSADVIMHFDTAGQPDFIGSQRQVLLMLATGGVIVLINLFLVRVLDKREHFAAQIIAHLTLLLSILLFIATSVIISNNR